MSLFAVVRVAAIQANLWYKRLCTDDIRTISHFRRVA